MMDGIAKLLSDPSNYAVVQLPGCAFPGVVFQGDSIHALIAQLQAALNAARKHADDELNAAFRGPRQVEIGLREERDGHALARELITPNRRKPATA